MKKIKQKYIHLDIYYYDILLYIIHKQQKCIHQIIRIEKKKFLFIKKERNTQKALKKKIELKQIMGFFLLLFILLINFEF